MAGMVSAWASTVQIAHCLSISLSQTEGGIRQAQRACVPASHSCVRSPAVSYPFSFPPCRPVTASPCLPLPRDPDPPPPFAAERQ